MASAACTPVFAVSTILDAEATAVAAMAVNHLIVNYKNGMKSVKKSKSDFRCRFLIDTASNYDGSEIQSGMGRESSCLYVTGKNETTRKPIQCVSANALSKQLSSIPMLY